MIETLQAVLNRYARKFVDEADRDYILARHCYRNQYDLQYAWLQSQSLEKYLKAILLFNGKSSRYKKNFKGSEFSHDICSLYEAVKEIDFMEIKAFPEIEMFIRNKKNGAFSRYGTHNVFYNKEDLDYFDWSVFEIRKYCKSRFGFITLGGKEYNQLSLYCETVNKDEFRSRPAGGKYIAQMEGHLLKVLKPKSCKKIDGLNRQRDDLLWENNSFCSIEDFSSYQEINTDSSDYVALENSGLHFDVPREEIEKYVRLPPLIIS
jgi:hypothetical protein